MATGSLGSPAPGWVRWAARASALTLVAVMAGWVFQHLGGLALAPRETAPGVNDTGVIFNWHPLLMAVAFPLLMSEAVVAYRAPLVGGDSQARPRKKMLHGVLHATAASCIVLSAVAAFKSHSLKLPQPIPDLYSAHSWMGLATLALLGTQMLLAGWAYVFPGWTSASKRSYGPGHIFGGLAVYILGLATMATGLQEKATFLQTLGKKEVRDPALVMPAVMVLLLAATGGLYLYHHAPPRRGDGSSLAGEDGNATPGAPDRSV
eukprot:jgi/Tetstr1/441563/TSEL_029792.t1